MVGLQLTYKRLILPETSLKIGSSLYLKDFWQIILISSCFILYYSILDSEAIVVKKLLILKQQSDKKASTEMEEAY